MRKSTVYDSCFNISLIGQIFNENNEWYPGGLQISFHIDLPDF